MSQHPSTVDPTGLYIHSKPYVTEKGESYYTLPERVPNDLLVEVDYHVVVKGERIHDIALLYYRGQHPAPVDLWEPLAQVQIPPLQDPHRPLPPGSVVRIPSISELVDLAYGQSLTPTPEI